MSSNARELASYASSLPSLRNLLINGAAQISQRGDVDGIVMSGSSNEYTAADRWCIGKANVGENGTLDTTVTNQVLRIDVNTINTNQQTTGATTLRQIIEAQNCFHLSGQQVTLSFKFKTNKLGNYGVFLFGYDANAYVTPQTMEVTNTNTNSYSFTFTAPSSIANDTGEGIGVNITLWAGSARADTFYVSADGQADFFNSTANYCELSEVQLELGTVATPFEHRPYGVELSLCQRYYEKSYSDSTVPGTTGLGNGGGVTLSNLSGSTAGNILCLPSGIPFKITKRATPTIVAYDYDGTANALRVYPTDGKRTGVTSFANIQHSGAFQFISIDNSSSTAISSGNGIAFHWTAAAEL